MEIKDLNSLGLPKKIEKSASEEIKPKKVAKDKKDPEKTKRADNVAQIDISKEAKELQKSDDELKVAKELLAKLPSFRAHIIYQALAKLRAGVFSEDQIMAEVAEKLVDSGELDDLFRF